jgi:hypothetical protein
VTFYFVFWLVFAAAAIWATYCVLFARPQNNTVLPDWVGWLCFSMRLIVAWAVTIGVPYSLLGLCWSEWIEVSEKAFSWGATGFLAPKPTNLALGEVCELFLGHSGEPSDLESFLTLNVLSPRGRLRWGVVAARGQGLAVGTVSHAAYMISVPPEGEDLSPGFSIPDPHRLAYEAETKRLLSALKVTVEEAAKYEGPKYRAVRGAEPGRTMQKTAMHIFIAGEAGHRTPHQIHAMSRFARPVERSLADQRVLNPPSNSAKA